MFPEAFLDRMNGLLGEEYDAFYDALKQERYHALRFNTLKRDEGGRNAAEVFGFGAVIGVGKAEHTDHFAHLKNVPWAENGFYYERQDQPGKHPYHEAGLYYIQEPSAMAPAQLLAAQPGERVLDLCAAPGGKSTQVAAGLKGEGILICNEIHPVRAKALSENVERMGIVNVCVTNEPPKRLAELFPGYFDKILVDAPCSGEGMFRKNQTACEEWSLENVKLCSQRQDEILDCAAVMLRPGGRLVYSTCTFAPLENEGSVARFLKRHEEFTILPIDKESLGLAGCDGVPEWGDGRPELSDTLRLWPHKIQGEGHFAAVLQKEGDFGQESPRQMGGGTTRGLAKKEMPEFLDFCWENLKLQRSGDIAELGDAVGLNGEVKFVRFGANLHLAPAEMPDMRGMKVLRLGLHLGEIKKDRFEPSHALALALSPGRVAHIWRFEVSDPNVSAYLGGQTFSAEGEKGWYLICVDGFSLGWGKLVGGVMKNHYPKRLRKV